MKKIVRKKLKLLFKFFIFLFYPKLMIFLIGTHHERQHNGHGSKSNADNKDFAKYVRQIISEEKIYLIGEEFSKEALEKSHASKSTLEQIAKDLDIIHCFCDPNTIERKKIGIPSNEELRQRLNSQKPTTVSDIKANEKKFEKEKEKYNTKRETYWLNKLKNKRRGNILFICGTNHLASFHKLLTLKSIKASILEKSF